MVRSDTFSCPGYRIVEDRKIRCHKVGGHGAETFVQGIQNSCNPVFIDIGLRLGTGRFCDYFEQFGLLGKTGVDLPGEAATIMHKEENIGQVELATMSFGQSFQVTPIQMAVTVSALVNVNKYRITGILYPLDKRFLSMSTNLMTPDFSIFYNPVSRTGKCIRQRNDTFFKTC